ncbi:MAG: type IX secretion system outer membrane channel protein PorV [Bacteroidota bacterium]
MKLRAALVSLLAIGFAWPSFSFDSSVIKNDTINDPNDLIGAQKAITTAVPFLAITPDARSAAMGDAGVATTPDAHAAYWNAAKLVFIDKAYGGSFNYTPWLGKIVNDMWIFSAAGFYQITREQAVAMSFKYFDLGEISFRGNNNEPLGDFNPKELAVDATYSRLLTENLSVGLTGRYIFSNLTGAFTGSDAQAGNSVAADIAVFYTKELQSARGATLSLGAQISNIGAKISYTDNANKDFLPTNLRIGSAFTTQLDPYNTITFALDFNKLMVPTIDKDQTLLSGMFGSFGDAPGGAKEEIHEIMTSLGIEYWYNETFAARAGYFLEAKDKGNRKYMTLGLGFRKNNFGIDAAYIVPTNQREHPLAETLRFSVLFQIKKDTSVPEETVTD